MATMTRNERPSGARDPAPASPLSVAVDDIVVPAIDGEGRLFPARKLEVHQTGQQHQAVSVFVFCGNHLLIQRRAEGKYHCGGMWANTCCTHPHWGESPAACAPRRLREEVGLVLPLEARAIVDYRAAVTNGLIENERVHVFEGTLPQMRLDMKVDPAEVAELRWVDQAELRAAIAADPERFTPWLRIYLDRWHELALRPAA